MDRFYDRVKFKYSLLRKHSNNNFKKSYLWVFPGDAVVENLPVSAGNAGSSPGLGKSHMARSNQARAPQLLSLSSRACEPQLLSLSATTTEALTPRAHAPQQEKPLQ